MAHSTDLGQFILLNVWEIAQMRQKNYSIAEVTVDSQISQCTFLIVLGSEYSLLALVFEFGSLLRDETIMCFCIPKKRKSSNWVWDKEELVINYKL